MKAWVLVSLLVYHIVGTQQRDDEGEGGVGCRTLSQTVTYRGTRYMFFTTPVTWDEATVICPSYQARLAMPNSMERSLFLSNEWASSDMAHMDSIWLGARKYPGKNWTWINGEEVPKQEYSDWPFWRRRVFREGKDCMALMRRKHPDPAFADLDCGLLRPFICEKSTKLNADEPVPTSWVKYRGTQYTFYSGRLNWYKATAFCRKQGKRIGKVLDLPLGEVFKGAMTKSRPALEMAWIGGHVVDNKWQWITDGSAIPPVRNRTSEYPPWMDDTESSHGDCLLFDKHSCKEGQFVALSCTRKRSFICEEQDKLAPYSTIIEKLEFPCGQQTCILVDAKLNWFKARKYCQDRYKQDLVQLVNKEQTALISDAMDDHPNEVRHVWIGGRRLQGDPWKWVDDTPIPPMRVRTVAASGAPRTTMGPHEEYMFPPWCEVDVLRTSESQDLCLNLDRLEYREGGMYGLACNDTQAFICTKQPSTQQEDS